MVLLEPAPWAMVVMEGSRLVARAKKVQAGGWLLRLYGACWVDSMTNEERIAGRRRMRIPLEFGADLKVVATKAAARKELMAVAGLR